MSKNTTQEERLDYLVEEFKADSAEYKELQTPKSPHYVQKSDEYIQRAIKWMGLEAT